MTASLRVRSAVAGVCSVLASLTCAFGASIYVSPSGTSGGAGTQSSPKDLASVLSSSTLAKPGDTVWLMGGTYNGGITSNLTGNSTSAITVRPIPGAKAIIDGVNSTNNTLTVSGSYTWYRDFIVTNSDSDRSKARPTALDIFAPNSKFINLEVKNGGVGIGFWTPAANSELYGCISHHNGYDLSDRGHGHALYTQNLNGTKLVSDNLFYWSYGYGVHAYTQGGNIDNFDFLGNISFNNGFSSYHGATTNYLVGGYVAAHNITFHENLAYYPNGGTNAQFYYTGTGSQNLDVHSNYLAGGNNGLLARYWTGANVKNNFVWSNGTITYANNNSTVTWDLNSYVGNANSSPFSYNGTGYNFSGWRSASGYDAGGTYTAPSGGKPSGTKVFVRPNKYETGRAHVAIYNWNRAGAVAVDISGAVSPGTYYEVRNALGLDDVPVLSGVYSGGTVNFPMNGYSTGPEFGAFLVRTPPQPTKTLTVQSTPATGIAIAGTSPGTTNYFAQVAPNSQVDLTAPSFVTVGATAYAFVRWNLAGVDQTAGQATLSFNMAQDMTAIAVYEVAVMRSLNVQSTPITSVSIAGTPSGVTNFWTQLPDGTLVSLNAPPQLQIGGNQYFFRRWTRNGVPQTDEVPNLSFVLNSTTTCVAVYEADTPRTLNVLSTPITGVGITGSSPGTTDYSLTLQYNSVVTLTAPDEVSTGGGIYVFQRWTLNGTLLPDGDATMVFHIGYHTDAVAEYALASMLTVQSAPFSGVHIKGTAPGITSYNGLVLIGDAVTLTAPLVVHSGGASQVLTHWTMNGAAQPDGLDVLAFPMEVDTTACANYAASPLNLAYPTAPGVVIHRGATCNIQWTFGTPLTTKSKIKVDLVNSTGGKWELSKGAKNSGVFKWSTKKWSSKTQPVYPDGMDYRIRISTPGGAVLDESESPFAVQTGP
jgi:hypothetical protein